MVEIKAVDRKVYRYYPDEKKVTINMVETLPTDYMPMFSNSEFSGIFMRKENKILSRNGLIHPITVKRIYE